jgi:hypothetical protein
MDTVETVKIKSPVSEGNPLGYVVINKCDLTDEHELFEPAADVAKPETQESAAEPVERQKRPYTRRQ